MSDAQLARLIVSLEAKMDNYEKGLDKALAKAQGTSGQIKGHLDAIDDRFDKLFGHSDPGKALDNVFSRARFNLIDEGGKRLSIFGSAIEDLGPAGIAGAAALAALAFGMERVSKAVEYGASIAVLAKTTGVATDFIQEFNFAARQNEIDVGAADEALKKLNISFGAVQSGLANKQQVNAFAGALGLKPGEVQQYLQGFRDLSDFFPVLVERIQSAGSAAEQAAIAKRLGIEELLPMLKDGADGFNALAQKARDLGIVMDEATIKKSEDAKKKMSELDDVMKAMSNQTFAQFADTLIKLKGFFLDLEAAVLRFFQAYDSPSAHLAYKMMGDIIQNAQHGRPTSMVIDLVRDAKNYADAKANPTKDFTGYVDDVQDTIRQFTEGQGAGAAKTLVPPTPKRAKTDRTQQALDDSIAKEAAAHAAVLQTLLAQATEFDAQLALERQITTAEKTKINAEYDKREKDVTAAKDIQDSQKDRIVANLEIARQEELQALDQKEAAKLVALQLAQEKLRVDNLVKLDDIEASILSSRAQLATTAKERAALEMAALQKRQEAEQAQARQTMVEAFAKGDVGAFTRAAGVYDATMSRQKQDTAALAAQNADPVQKYLKSVQDLDTEFQNEGVSAVQSLASGLADAAVNAKSFGDVMSNVVKQLLQQALDAALQHEGAALLALIPGFASGTDFAPGGLAMVGERGPELINLPRGSQVFSAAATANGVRGAGSAVMVTQHFYLDGAVTTDALMARVDAISSQKAIGAAAVAKQETLRSLRTGQQNRLGR